jgi:type IV conjugative transfer system protein TraE
MSDPKQNYLDSVANAFQTAQAWKTATYTLGAAVIFLVGALIYQQRNTPVVLVPHDLAASSARVTVTTNGEIRGTSSEYMANTAMSDASLILNFIPDNVVTQTTRFLNRLTEDLYGEQREQLLAQAEDFKRRGVTQSFYPSEIKVSPDGTRVQIDGTQLRWVGGKETLRAKLTYVITYKVYKGYLHVADLRQQQDKK